MSGKLQHELKKSKPFDSLEQEVYLNLQRTAEALGRGVTDLFKPHGLSPTQYNALRILRGAGSDGLPCQEVGQRMGVNMREIWWTLGQHDIVCVLEAADEASITAFNLVVAGQGNVRSQTLRAFNAAEMDKVLAKLP